MENCCLFDRLRVAFQKQERERERKGFDAVFNTGWWSTLLWKEVHHHLVRPARRKVIDLWVLLVGTFSCFHAPDRHGTTRRALTRVWAAAVHRMRGLFSEKGVLVGVIVVEFFNKNFSLSYIFLQILFNTLDVWNVVKNMKHVFRNVKTCTWN